MGPLTLSMLTRDAAGAAPHDDPETLLWLARFLGRAAAAQARALQAVVPRVVLVFDEPALASVEEPRLPITWRSAVAVLREALAPVQALGAIAGLHACAPPNWTRALAARPNLIHFDGREGRLDDLLEHRSALREHVARGGYLGWGLWPTDAPSRPFDAKAMQYYLARAAREIAFVDSSMGDLQALVPERGVRRGGPDGGAGGPDGGAAGGDVDGHPASLLDRGDNGRRSGRPADLRSAGRAQELSQISGSTKVPPMMISKCRWGPEERPVLPTKPIRSPGVTVSPRSRFVRSSRREHDLDGER